MAATKKNAELPASETLRLKALRGQEDQRALHERAVALRQRDWPLRAIGEAVGVSRMTVHVWQKDVEKNPDAMKRVRLIKDVPDLPLNARGSGVTTKKMKVDVPEHDREKLRELAAKARTVRRWSTPDSPERIASDQLDQLVVKYVEHRGVAPMTVARHAEVTRRAIMARLERIHARQAAREDISA